MDKKGTRILVGCILCTMIVLMLFIVVIKFTQLSCELVSLEPVALRASQLADFSDNKPVRSHDKTILMKISAYLEYNVEVKKGNKPEPQEPPGRDQPAIASPTGWQAPVSNNQPQPAANKSLPTAAGPQPSVPQNAFNPQQNTSFFSANNSNNNLHLQQALGQPSYQQHTKAEKRFLPLKLKSIETRNLGDTKHKYILSFNCTKLNMVLVHQAHRVYVGKMDLELKPVGIRQKSTCELQLPPTGAFAVESEFASSAPLAPTLPVQTNATMAGQRANSSLPEIASGGGGGKESKESWRNLAHYFCDKPLVYKCFHYNRISGPNANNGLLLAELHINAIEFETSTSPKSKGEHKHVKSEFKSKRSECLAL